MEIKWTPWTKPSVLRTYKYKGFIIEYWVMTCSSPYSVLRHHEFVGFKDGKRVTSKRNQHQCYSDCVNEIKDIIKNGK